jgi:hypothetical protein
MIPSTRDYNEFKYGYDYYDSPNTKKQRVDERERKELEDLYTKNVFPLTIEEYVLKLENEIVQLKRAAVSKEELHSAKAAEFRQHFTNRINEKDELLKSREKTQKIVKRKCETLVNRIGKLLTDFEDEHGLFCKNIGKQ